MSLERHRGWEPGQDLIISTELEKRVETLEQELAFVAYALRQYDIYRPPAEAQERLREIIARYDKGGE